MSDPEARLRDIFGLEEWQEPPDVTDVSLEGYLEYLGDHLELPLEAAYDAEEEPDSITIQVHGFISVEDSPDDPEMYGLFCEATQGTEMMVLPLAVIEVVDPNHENHDHVELYKEWFWNYR